MNWLSINFKDTFQALSPTFLRGENFQIFISSFSAALQSLSDELLYNMQHDSRVIYLEKVLNEYLNADNYDFLNHELTKLIYIDDAPKPPLKYLYLQEEIPPKEYLYLGTKYLTGNEDYFDFFVFIPANYVFVEAKVRAIIDYYKLAGKKYKLVII
jgi:hypothetical protein